MAYRNLIRFVEWQEKFDFWQYQLLPIHKIKLRLPWKIPDKYHYEFFTMSVFLCRFQCWKDVILAVNVEVNSFAASWMLRIKWILLICKDTLSRYQGIEVMATRRLLTCICFLCFPLHFVYSYRFQNSKVIGRGISSKHSVYVITKRFELCM